MHRAIAFFRGGNGFTLALLFLLLMGAEAAPVAAAGGEADGGVEGAVYLADRDNICTDETQEGCSPAYVELGNRAWLDENSNGVQDAGEPGFMGLVVNAYILDVGGSFMLRATTVTDSEGHYRFSDLEPATTYYIVVEDVSDAGEGVPHLVGGLYGPSLGVDRYRVNTATGGSELPWAGYPYYEYTVGPSGDINHDLDFAFAPEAVNAPTAITWSVSNARGLLQSPFLAALLLLAVLLGCLWLVVRSLALGRRRA